MKLIIGTNSLLQAAKSLMQSGTITLEQYVAMLRRNDKEHLKRDIAVA